MIGFGFCSDESRDLSGLKSIIFVRGLQHQKIGCLRGAKTLLVGIRGVKHCMKIKGCEKNDTKFKGCEKIGQVFKGCEKNSRPRKKCSRRVPSPINVPPLKETSVVKELKQPVQNRESDNSNNLYFKQVS